MARAKISSTRGVMGGAGVTVLGVPELIARLNRINIVARIHTGYLITQAAAFLAIDAIERAPIRTGNLKTAIKPGKAGSYDWYVLADTTTGSDPGGEGKNAYEYAGYVEWGTTRMSPRPFMAPAVADTIPVLHAALEALARDLERL